MSNHDELQSNLIGVNVNIARHTENYFYTQFGYAIGVLYENLLQTLRESGIFGSPTTREQKKILQEVADEVEATLSIFASSQTAKLEELLELTAILSSELSAKAVNDIFARRVILGLRKFEVELLLEKTYVQGVAIDEGFESFKQRLFSSLIYELRKALVAYEALEEFEKRLYGPYPLKTVPVVDDEGNTLKTIAYTAGIFGLLDRQARTFIRTAVANFSEASRIATFMRNGEIVKGFQLIVALDSQTSKICRPRALMAWSFEGKPLTRHTTIKYPGYPPYHWNCRTTTIPVFADITDLGKDGVSTRTAVIASFIKRNPQFKDLFGSPVSQGMTYEMWLKRKA